MTIHERVAALRGRMFDTPQYHSQGNVLFVDLFNRATHTAYLPKAVYSSFLGGRGANMFLLYNLMGETANALDPQIPLIFGTGVLTGYLGTATRGNVTSLSPDSDALLDSSAGDWFPSYMRRHGYDHIVLYGRPAEWVMLKIQEGEVDFIPAQTYLGLDNIDLTAALERDFDCKERKDMALARITRAGENEVLCSGIMGGPKAIWARGGAGAKMGALRLKAIMLLGNPPKPGTGKTFKQQTKDVNRKIASCSVIRNALKTVGTPFLYKPSRVLGALGALNNQETTWVDDLDADNFDGARTTMDGCHKCFVKCRPMNDMTPEAEGGFGADALVGLSGNASYEVSEADRVHEHGLDYNGIKGDGVFDRYDKGDGPEYVTVGKFGPNIGIRDPRQVMRLNNILNDLGLDSSSTGGALGWAMELYQRGIIDKQDTEGLELTWGNYPIIEKLLFMTARREGFGSVIADSARAVQRGRYPPAALEYRMAVKGLFQSDPHDSRILKAFALGMAVATRGMDHLRNRVTLEINARINDDGNFKTSLYGGQVSPEPNSYTGKEYAVRRCEDVFAVGDAIGMCRFDTQLFNSPSLPGCDDFAPLLRDLTETDMDTSMLMAAGRNIMGLERMINARLGLSNEDDTLPQRWFDEPITVGPFKGEKIQLKEFNALKRRFYTISGLDDKGRPNGKWRERLSRTVTGYAVTVKLPSGPKQTGHTIVIDQPVANVVELRRRVREHSPEAAEFLDDGSIGVAINGEMVLVGEKSAAVANGDEVSLVPVIAGG